MPCLAGKGYAYGSGPTPELDQKEICCCLDFEGNRYCHKLYCSDRCKSAKVQSWPNFSAGKPSDLAGTKLQWYIRNYGLSGDYMLHFKSRSMLWCSNFAGIPLHESAVGTALSVNLKNHCDTTIASAEKRPTVSNSLDVLSNSMW